MSYEVFKKKIRSLLPALKIFGIELGIIVLTNYSFDVIFQKIDFHGKLAGFVTGNDSFYINHLLYQLYALCAIYILLVSSTFFLGVMLAHKWCESKKQKTLTVWLLPTHWYLLLVVIALVIILFLR